jgi:2-polyprenyl-6-methoxyphenol hydroxylase-like FAD-dependent oxidoreductase
MTQPVLVIGAGPVGLTLTSELARYGVPVRVIDKAAARTDKSKALVLWSRTLELLDRGGMDGSAPFVAAGLHMEAVNFVAGARTIGRVELGSIDSPYPYGLMLPQSDTERLLEERLAGQGISVERRVELASFVSHDSGVEAVLRHADGREETTSAAWLVGCDGAHSVVRHAIGAPFSGDTFDSDWMLADIHMRGYPSPETECTVYWHREGVLVIFPISPGRFRVIADLPPTGAEQPPTPTLEQVQALLDHRGPPGLVVFDPVWLAGFRINDRKVAEYRHGRAFLAGDAAHIHSPAGGQGMNTGMQDAFNLAWKLAMVERGNAGASLLDSYSPERSAVGDQVLKAAGRLTTIGTVSNPVIQQLRNTVGHVMLGLPFVTHTVADTMSEVTIAYPHSPLNGPGLHDGPRPGERAALVTGERPPGSGGTPLFTLHAEHDPEIAELTGRFDGLLDPEPRPPLRVGTICLVRPDGYVAMTAERTGWAAVRDYLAHLAGPGKARAPLTMEPHDASGTNRAEGPRAPFTPTGEETAGAVTPS